MQFREIESFNFCFFAARLENHRFTKDSLASVLDRHSKESRIGRRGDLSKGKTLVCTLSINNILHFLQLFETHPETLKPFIPDVKSLEELELNEW